MSKGYLKMELIKNNLAWLLNKYSINWIKWLYEKGNKDMKKGINVHKDL